MISSPRESFNGIQDAGGTEGDRSTVRRAELKIKQQPVA